MTVAEYDMLAAAMSAAARVAARTGRPPDEHLGEAYIAVRRLAEKYDPAFGTFAAYAVKSAAWDAWEAHRQEMGDTRHDGSPGGWRQRPARLPEDFDPPARDEARSHKRRARAVLASALPQHRQHLELVARTGTQERAALAQGVGRKAVRRAVELERRRATEATACLT